MTKKALIRKLMIKQAKTRLERIVVKYDYSGAGKHQPSH